MTNVNSIIILVAVLTASWSVPATAEQDVNAGPDGAAYGDPLTDRSRPASADGTPAVSGVGEQVGTAADNETAGVYRVLAEAQLILGKIAERADVDERDLYRRCLEAMEVVNQHLQRPRRPKAATPGEGDSNEGLGRKGEGGQPISRHVVEPSPTTASSPHQTPNAAAGRAMVATNSDAVQSALRKIAAELRQSARQLERVATEIEAGTGWAISKEQE
jgi:hypothetical protein